MSHSGRSNFWLPKTLLNSVRPELPHIWPRCLMLWSQAELTTQLLSRLELLWQLQFLTPWHWKHHPRIFSTTLSFRASLLGKLLHLTLCVLRPAWIRRQTQLGSTPLWLFLVGTLRPKCLSSLPTLKSSLWNRTFEIWLAPRTASPHRWCALGSIKEVSWPLWLMLTRPSLGGGNMSLPLS